QPRPRPRPRPLVLGVMLAGLVMVLALPARSWRDAWPVSLLGAWVEGRMGDAGIGLPLLPNVRTSPRNRFETWGAQRDEPAQDKEVYVLVIGESVRADRVPGCGGRPQVTRAPDDALLYCDVLAGSSGTHTSIP